MFHVAVIDRQKVSDPPLLMAQWFARALHRKVDPVEVDIFKDVPRFLIQHIQKLCFSISRGKELDHHHPGATVSSVPIPLGKCLRSRQNGTKNEPDPSTGKRRLDSL